MASNRINFTVRKIESLKPPAGGQADYWDAGFAGFGMRLSWGGAKSWVYMYRNSNGVKRRYTIGRYPAWSLSKARDVALKLAGEIADGGDPAKDKRVRRSAGTFKELGERYIEEHAKPNKKSWRKDQLALNRDLLPEFGLGRANAITQEDVEALIEGIRDRGAPIQSNRTLEILRGMFNWALSKAKVRREFQLFSNPCLGVRKLSDENERDRVLSNSEIKQVWEAAGADASRTAAAFKLLLMTAQRIGEVRSMRWGDIDTDIGWWTIPSELSKNGLAHRVPLTTEAIKLIEGLADKKTDDEWIFPQSKGEGHVVNIQKLAARIRKASKVKDFRPHDIRRSVASGLASMGFPRLTVSKVLNHIETDVTRVYDRYGYDNEKRQALEVWGQQLDKILSGGRAGNVVQLKPGDVA